jgi:hypothetical protein
MELCILNKMLWYEEFENPFLEELIIEMPSGGA